MLRQLRGKWLAAAGLAIVALSAPAQATIVERVVAIIGDDAVLLTDVQERARPFMVSVFEQVPEGPQRAAAISRIYKVVLDRMIDEELEDLAAARAGIVVSTAEVDEALDRVARQNNLSPGTILAEAKRSGLTVSQYRDELRRQVLQAKLGSLRFQGRIQIQEADVAAAYLRLVREERMQLSQRLVRLAVPAGQTSVEASAANKLADSISARARRGEDFQLLAQEYSTGSSAGLAPARPPIQEPPEIQRASLALEVGETSRPIPVGGELVIIQVVERAPSSLPPYEQAMAALQERVYMEKMAEARRRWLDGLRRRTHVELRM